MQYYINLKDVKSFVELNGGKVLSKKKSTRVIDGEYVDGWTFYLDRTNLPKVKNACKDYVNIKCFQAWVCNYLPFDQLFWTNRSNSIHLRNI